MLQLEPPVNTTNVLAQSQQLIPDVATQAAQRQLMQAQASEAQQGIAIRNYQIGQMQSFGPDMQNFLQNPSASGIAAMFAKYPQFQQQLSDAWSTLSAEQKRSELTQLGSAASLVAKGDYQGAAGLVQSRIQADQAAGRDTTSLQQMLSMLQTGDAKQITPVLGMMAASIASAVPPDKAKDYLSSIGLNQEPIKGAPGDTFINEQGGTVAKVPALNTPQILNTPSGGQNLYGFNPNDGSINGGGAASNQPGGGGPASGGGAAAGGMDASVAHVLGNEGNQANGGWNPKDANGSPTNWGINFKANKAVLASMGFNASNFKSMTRDQAAQIYATKYWPQSGAANLPANMQAAYFDAYVRSPALAKSILAKTGPDPQAFTQAASQAFQKMAANPNSGTHPYANAWANRDAGNVALASGSASDAVPASGGSQAGPVSQAGPQPLVSTAPPNGLDTKGAEPGYAWNSSRTAQVPIPGTPNDPNSYSPQEIDDLARNWISTGPTAFASLGGGMGGGGIAQLKKAALARASEIMAQSGITADQLPAIRSKFSALNSSMTQNTQILNMLEASEKALHANAQQVLATQKPLVDAGIISDTSPWLNRTRLETYSHVGSGATKANIAAYEDAVNGLTQEYTKFMNSANGMGGNAAPSDSARHLAIDLNDPGYGPATMNKHINQIFTETGNKRTGIGAQNSSIQSQLSSLIGGKSQQSELPAGAKVIGTYQGRRVIEVNGQRLVEQ